MYSIHYNGVYINESVYSDPYYGLLVFCFLMNKKYLFEIGILFIVAFVNFLAWKSVKNIYPVGTSSPSVYQRALLPREVT